MSRKQPIIVRTYKSRRKMERDLNRLARRGYVVSQSSGTVDSFARRMVMPFIFRRNRATVTYKLSVAPDQSEV